MANETRLEHALAKVKMDGHGQDPPQFQAEGRQRGTTGRHRAPLLTGGVKVTRAGPAASWCPRAFDPLSGTADGV